MGITPKQLTRRDCHIAVSSNINPYMPRDFVNTKYPEAKSLPFFSSLFSFFSNGGLQKTTGRNTQPSLLCVKEIPLQRFMSAGCQNYTPLQQINKPVMRPEYGTVGINGLIKVISFSPTSIPPSSLLPVPNKPCGFCGR